MGCYGSAWYQLLVALPFSDMRPDTQRRVALIERRFSNAKGRGTGYKRSEVIQMGYRGQKALKEAIAKAVRNCRRLRQILP
jgi:hypothetical protein